MSVKSRDASVSVKGRRSPSNVLTTEKVGPEDNKIGFQRERRHSTGTVNLGATTQMMPFELVKKPIKPLGIPLASDQVHLPELASTETELIVNRLESIEERKDPEKQWTKVTKYAVYAVRGFGTFKPAIGLGVFGVDLQKTIRRQANGLKHALWDLKIRVPITNRISTGIALMRWGAEDGKQGSKESIMLGDCYPMDSQSFEQFKLSGERN